ncbi:hypothetical protein NAL32_21920 [Chryseobacterium sp. Ch-15]|uniref:Uncharacterized protein n=1 Tax=Chryseobacterium muglaense TaxID=2893752 RepID=A0A9Q3V0M8_9FLAO|nr:hypothetical protein [Chryseobacterium muglaense]MBD3905659.1 hypothetical protein [Chryseobacterium muglaense]MCC9036380.1 hypothetical protein [Chryseobacterium muglaense]MCM2557047.1 hypothetical protein [Chryseobacterium muglaense]
MKKLFHLLFLLIFFNLYSQNIQTEFFVNENQIEESFKLNSRIEKLFTQNSKDSILVVTETKNDSLFSIYVKNNGQKDVLLIPQDNKLTLIQEAFTQDKKWKPIEFWVNSDCGMSYLKKINIKSGEIIGLRSKKYKGNFKTKIRFKLLINKQVYYSNSITASINTSKFEKSAWYNRFKEMYYPDKSDKEVENIFFLNE